MESVVELEPKSTLAKMPGMDCAVLPEAKMNGQPAGAKSAPVQRKDYESRERRRWLNRLADEFLALEGLFPWKELRETDCPDWVWRVEQEYAVATFKLADPKRAKKLTVCGFGSFLGYQCAYAVWMTESFVAMHEDYENHPERYKDLVVSKEMTEQGANALRRYDEWYAALRHLAGRALKSCVYHSYEDMSGFVLAFGRAFAKKPQLGAGVGDFGNSNFGIYHFMLWHWRAIERLDSVRELHDLLRQRLGSQATGDLKRVEKICQRVHLHFRKPGRPKKSEK